MPSLCRMESEAWSAHCMILNSELLEVSNNVSHAVPKSHKAYRTA